MTKRTTKPEPTAAETYAARAADVARLIDLLQMELDNHGASAKADPTNWGFADDLGRIRHKLINMVSDISTTMDDQDIEAFLAE